MKICITGGIGSGKSTVARILRSQGEFVLSADEINAELLTQPEYQQKLKKLFPSAVRCGRVNRRAIRNEISTDAQKRQALNDLSHGEIFARIQAKTAQVSLAFVEVPLLNVQHKDQFDLVWYVDCNDTERVRRIAQRDGTTEDEARAIMAAQADYACIKEYAAAIIHTDKVSDLEAEIKGLLKEVKAKL